VPRTAKHNFKKPSVKQTRGIQDVSHKGEAHSASKAFFLDNPIRRWRQPPLELIGKLAIHPTDVVVDYGCGPGFFTLELARRAQTVIAIDLSATMLQKAKNKAAKAGARNIRFLQSNGTSLQLENGKVDLILLVTVYHEVGDNETVLRQFRRILKPDGKLIIVEVIKEGSVHGAPVQDPEKLKAEIESAGFRLVEMQPYKKYGILRFTKQN
jgi:SAM-dependent methyltransferase